MWHTKSLDYKTCRPRRLEESFPNVVALALDTSRQRIIIPWNMIPAIHWPWPKSLCLGTCEHLVIVGIINGGITGLFFHLVFVVVPCLGMVKRKYMGMIWSICRHKSVWPKIKQDIRVA
jgi:hypothetical protein